MIRSTASSGSQVYTSGRAVSEYLLFHFGKSFELFPYNSDLCPKNSLNFIENSANICGNLINKNNNNNNKSRILDIGCAVGGTSFYLSKYFDEVIGIDYSEQFINTANNMKLNKEMKYEVYTEGIETINLIAKLPLDNNIDPNKCIFLHGDACDLNVSLNNLKKLKNINYIESYDIILGSNLLCRLPKPRQFLSSLFNINSFYYNENNQLINNIGLIKPYGYLILISPYSWLEEYTEKNEWLFDFNNKDISSSTSCNNSFSILSNFIQQNCNTINKCNNNNNNNNKIEYGLQLVKRNDIPFIIREHARKYQFGLSDCTIWQNRPIVL